MKKLFLLLPFISLCSACAEESFNLKGTAYQYQLNNTPVLLAFDSSENRYYGKVVNNYFGTYNQNENNVTFSLGGSTMMMGPKNEMDDEQKWFKILPEISYIIPTDEGIELTLKNGQKLNMKKTAFPK